MKKHSVLRFGMVPLVLLSLVLIPLSGARGQELAQDQT